MNKKYTEKELFQIFSDLINNEVTFEMEQRRKRELAEKIKIRKRKIAKILS